MPGPVYAGERVTAGNINADLAFLTTGSVSNATAETVIGTFSSGYPAGDATAAGDSYVFRVWGDWDVTSTPNLDLRIRADSLTGSIIYEGGGRTANGTATAQGWYIACWLTWVTTGSGGTVDTATICPMANTNSFIWNNQVAVSLDSTITHTFVVTAQFNAASSSNVARTRSGLMARL